MKYHSALHKPNSYPLVGAIQLGNSFAFSHDLMRKDVPSDYNDCDIFYMEPPWIDGFKIFEDRANISHERTYEDLMLGVSKFVFLGKPAVIITGKKGLKYLPKPDAEAGTILNGAAARVVMYGTTVANVSNCMTILDELAGRYFRVGDPCCGFGRTAKAFKSAGKDFVVSDYNQECIGYIAQEWGGW